MPRNSGLPLRVRLAYGLPNLSLALVGVPILIYLPRFYSDVVGVPVAWLGVIFVAGRVIDAITDPLVGMISDRGRSSRGRRKPWVLWGCVPLALLSVALYVPPSLTGTLANVWASMLVLGWFVAYTMVNVPYRAWGPELTDDYDERTGLFSIREGLFVVGTLLAAVGPGIVELYFGDQSTERLKFAGYVAFAAPMLILACLVCVRGVPERFASADGSSGVHGGVREQLRQVFGNRPFLILLSAFVVIALGSSLPMVLISYFVRYVLDAERLLPLFLLAYFGVGMASLPAWVALSRRKGKKITWMAAVAVNAGFFAGVSQVGPGDVWLYGVLVMGSGIGGVAVLAMPYAMQADVIDHDEQATGERREGLYGGLWSIAEKTAGGLGLGVAMLILDAVGYQPNQAQPEHVLDVLRVLYIGVPCVCYAAGCVIVTRYPLDKKAHEAIVAGLTRQEPDPS